jgi:hypothetical protein
MGLTYNKSEDQFLLRSKSHNIHIGCAWDNEKKIEGKGALGFSQVYKTQHQNTSNFSPENYSCNSLK